MRRKVLSVALLTVLICALVAGTAYAASQTYLKTHTFYVVSGGVQVIKINMTAKHAWNTTTWKVFCPDSTYPRSTWSTLVPGWTLVAAGKSCSPVLPGPLATSFQLWDVYKSGVYKGHADTYVSSSQDTTPPNWSWSISENVP